jgi:hypothetical protein
MHNKFGLVGLNAAYLTVFYSLAVEVHINSDTVAKIKHPFRAKLCTVWLKCMVGFHYNGNNNPQL